jgi:hypothetical protein
MNILSLYPHTDGRIVVEVVNTKPGHKGVALPYTIIVPTEDIERIVVFPSRDISVGMNIPISKPDRGPHNAHPVDRFRIIFLATQSNVVGPISSDLPILPPDPIDPPPTIA